jgi:alkylation response protein AidB-like acyl-CoA dehydrogenase
MEFKLNEDQQMILELAQDIAQNAIAPRVEEIEDAEHFPEDLQKLFAESGFTGISFPEEYGGGGMGHIEQAIILKEIGRVSPSTACVLDVYYLGMEALELYGNHEQKKKYLEPCCTGEKVVSFAFTEPETGSDPKMLKTRLVKKGDGYVVNGVKRFISNAAYEGPIVLFGLYEDPEAGKDVVTGFVIDKFCKGYSISTPWEKIGFHGSEVYDVFLDDVEVSADQILGKHGDGFTQLLGTTAYGKLGFTGVFTGIALGAADIAVKYSKEKLHRGKPISKFPTTQLRIAELATYAKTVELMLMYAADVCDQNPFEGDNVPVMRYVQHITAQAKGYAAEMAPIIATRAVNALGAYGVTKEYQAERFLRDAAIAPNIEGAGDIQKLIYGMFILSQPADTKL